MAEYSDVHQGLPTGDGGYVVIPESRGVERVARAAASEDVSASDLHSQRCVLTSATASEKRARDRRQVHIRVQELQVTAGGGSWVAAGGVGGRAFCTASMVARHRRRTSLMSIAAAFRVCSQAQRHAVHSHRTPLPSGTSRTTTPPTSKRRKGLRVLRPCMATVHAVDEMLSDPLTEILVHCAVCQGHFDIGDDAVSISIVYRVARRSRRDARFFATQYRRESIVTLP